MRLNQPIRLVNQYFRIANNSNSSTFDFSSPKNEHLLLRNPIDTWVLDFYVHTCMFSFYKWKCRFWDAKPNTVLSSINDAKGELATSTLGRGSNSSHTTDLAHNFVLLFFSDISTFYLIGSLDRCFVYCPINRNRPFGDRIWGSNPAM